MCGIVGNIRLHDGDVVDLDAIVRVRDSMASRGPDAAGAWCSANGRVGLGHRRLSIIDLSDAGAQPMATSDGRLHVVFNGEIYNYQELRRALVAKGHRLRSNSDTEVLLHLYDEFGLEMFALLRGMYTFGLWDDAKQELILARDPLGIKPLYVAELNNEIWFASQVKALLQAGFPVSDDPAGQVGFYMWGHIPEPYTMFREIRELAPGTYIRIGISGQREVRCFWSLLAELSRVAGLPRASCEMSDDGLGELSDALRNSVTRHLVADVDVGLFLSSGRDSTTILALAAEAAPRSLRTLTIGFEEFRGTDRDETALAKSTAELFGAHHEDILFSTAELTAHLERFLVSMDQPTLDGFNTYLVCSAAATYGLKVAMSGIGGDETFAGYSTFEDLPRLMRWIKPVAALPALGRLFRLVSYPLIRRFVNPKFAGIIEYGRSWGSMYLLRRGVFMPWELCGVLDRDVVSEGLRELSTFGHLNDIGKGLPQDLHKIVALESLMYLQNQLLRDTDWASMAHSIEVRTPLVDAQLFIDVVNIASRYGWPRKHHMARTPRRPLPTDVLRRGKTGFGLPGFDPRWAAEGRRGQADARAEPPQRRWAREVFRMYRLTADQAKSRSCGQCPAGARPH
jgi:asparagine synthase (glutamine-hydrolysing)